MSLTSASVGDRPPIVVIAGMTGAGKTELALRLARDVGGELVGADSVQVVRGFDIGAAKPTAEELGGIPHHLLDVIDPDEELDAARYAALADTAIAGVAARGRVPIVVGGTGLWLRALVRGLVALPTPDPVLRARLEEEVARLGAPALHARLGSIDPRSAMAIHANDALRIVRALEVHAQTGEALGELRHRHALGAPRYPTSFVVLDRPRDALRSRIEERARDMVARGWVTEVRALLERWGPDARAFGSLGYRDVLAHVRGDIELDAALERAIRATWVYTRRQRTWFSGEPGIDVRLDANALDLEELRARVEAHLASAAADPTGAAA